MIRIFHRIVPRSYLVLGMIEVLILLSSPFAGLLVANTTRYFREIDFFQMLSISVVYAAVISGCMMIFGLYWKHRSENEFIDYARRMTASFVVGLMILALLFYGFPYLAIDRWHMFLTLVYSLILVTLVRILHHYFQDHESLKRRVLVLGTGKKAQKIEMLRRKTDRVGVNIIGFVPIYGETCKIDQEKLLTGMGALKDFALANQVEEIVLAVDDRRKSLPIDEILECKLEGIDIIDAGEFIERQNKKIRLDTLHPSSMIYSDGLQKAIANVYSKRLFDIFVSLLILFISSPIMLVTVISIWLESGFRGKIIYRQDRVGKDGRIFQVLKFRSMREDAEKDGKPQWAQKNDDRVTKNGKVIRMLRIDELPQLFNILKGDMSFVGPRPERPEFVEQLSQVIPYYNLRHKVKPGLTGWAQISYPYGASEKDAIEKLQYDLYYMRNFSLAFDLMILLQTAQAVLWGKGAR